MELKQYINIIKRWIWWIVLGAILGTVTAYYASINQKPMFVATAKVFISQPPRGELSELGYLSGQQLIQTYMELMVTEKIIEAVSSDIDYSIKNENIFIQQIRDTQIVTVKIEDYNPYKAAEFANALVQIFSEQQYLSQVSRYAESKTNLEEHLLEQGEIIDKNILILESMPSSKINTGEYERISEIISQAKISYGNVLQSYETLRIAEAQSYSFVELVETAQPNTIPIRPKVVTNTLLGGIVGLMVVGGIAFIVEFMDDTIRSPEEIETTLGLTSIGYIGETKNFNKKGKEIIYVSINPRSPVSESFRSIRTNIEFASVSSPLKTILVTSPGAEEGKSSIVSNLATSISQSGKMVAVVDADLRRPKIHKFFNVKNRVGLSEYFRGGTGLENILQKVSSGIYIITSGKLPPNPSELLGSNKTNELIETLSNQMNVILFDSPPGIVTDPVVLASKVDGVLIVVKIGSTKQKAFDLLVRELSKSKVRIIGVIYNHMDKNSAYGYYYGKNHYFDNPTNKTRKLKNFFQARKKKNVKRI